VNAKTQLGHYRVIFSGETTLDERQYRPCVVGVFIDASGQLLVGERADSPGSFQFPQGGIEPGETPEEAIIREMKEELGVASFSILKKTSDWLTYDFPEDFGHKIAKKYRGQKQQWFLLALSPNHQPDLSRASDEEFCSLRWMRREEVIKGIIHWKRAVYATALERLLDGN
jgi:putative (di)nucleoside polyphosphate hydrolase